MSRPEWIYGLGMVSAFFIGIGYGDYFGKSGKFWAVILGILIGLFILIFDETFIKKNEETTNHSNTKLDNIKEGVYKDLINHYKEAFDKESIRNKELWKDTKELFDDLRLWNLTILKNIKK